MSQQWTPEEQAAIAQIMKMVDEEEAQTGGVSRGVPDSLMPPQQPVFGMNDLLNPAMIPNVQPESPSESQMYRNAASKDISGAYDSVMESDFAKSVGRGFEGAVNTAKRVVTGPNHPIPVGLGSSHIQTRIETPQGPMQRYSDGKYYPLGTDLSKPQVPKVNANDRKVVGDLTNVLDGKGAPSDVGPDMNIREFATNYGVSYPAAEAILRKRGYVPKGK